MKKILLGVLLVLTTPAFATTWFVRQDGGTRYDATYNPTGECNGRADASYGSTGGTGTNKACAYAEFQYLWDFGNAPGASGTDHIAWVIAGGDTVVIRGCLSGEGSCRIGWDTPNGSTNRFCPFVGNNSCYNPTVPAGTSTQHTTFIGGYAYDHGGNASGGGTQPNAYRSNLTEIFGGYDLFYTFNLASTSYVDVKGIMLTVHNAVSPGNPGYPGNCTRGGSPAYPVACQTGAQPYDDNARNGFLLDANSANIAFTDVYVYGFSGSGLFGPMGVGISGTRMESSFNAGDAWQLDDGSDTANATGASLALSYFTAIGNGCYGEYPIVHSFPARACYDSSSGSAGGDTLSGQDSTLATLTLDHGYFAYNTKDSWIGPHTQVGTQTITDSYSYGNMGAQWKWGQTIGGSTTFMNNLVVGDCTRMGELIPGASQSFALSSSLGGAYLSAFCRGSETMALISRTTATNLFAGNTFIGTWNTSLLSENCGYYSIGNHFNPETNCNTTTYTVKDNIFLGYSLGGTTPSLYNDDSGGTAGISFTTSYNQQFGLANTTAVGGSACGVNNIACASPSLLSQPAQTITTAAALDVFNPFSGTGNSFYPATGSPVIGAGNAVSGLTADYYGTVRPSPPSMGAVEFGTPVPSASPTITGSATVTGSFSVQ